MFLQAIERKISSQLLDFQKHGVAFGISHSGRCMIADDMGLGLFFFNISFEFSFRKENLVRKLKYFFLSQRKNISSDCNR